LWIAANKTRLSGVQGKADHSVQPLEGSCLFHQAIREKEAEEANEKATQEVHSLRQQLAATLQVIGAFELWGTLEISIFFRLQICKFKNSPMYNNLSKSRL
jgi:hypothetical protein